MISIKKVLFAVAVAVGVSISLSAMAAPVDCADVARRCAEGNQSACMWLQRCL
jgi:hypothetical protein